MFVKGKFPELGCDWCYSSCAVCSTLSWKGQENGPGKPLHACHRWLRAGSVRLCQVPAASCLGPMGPERAGGPKNGFPWGRCCLTQGLLHSCVHAARSVHFLWRNCRGSSTRQTEAVINVHNCKTLFFCSSATIFQQNFIWKAASMTATDNQDHDNT